jgi:hypothetical protein
MTRLRIVPIELKEANAFVFNFHRHHKPTQGHRFSIGCIGEDGVVHGVCIVGRPVARNTNLKEVLEVTRLCTDGTSNACSFLYSAAARIGKAMGYKKIQTFILDSEIGTSLMASGWKYEIMTNGGQWIHTDGNPRRTDQPICEKQRWGKCLI